MTNSQKTLLFHFNRSIIAIIAFLTYNDTYAVMTQLLPLLLFDKIIDNCDIPGLLLALLQWRTIINVLL